jgi:hypothetical protein
MASGTYSLTVNFDENVETVNIQSGDITVLVQTSGKEVILKGDEIYVSVNYKPGYKLFSLIATGSWENAFSEIKDGKLVMKPLGDFSGAIIVKSKKVEV